MNRLMGNHIIFTGMSLCHFENLLRYYKIYEMIKYNMNVGEEFFKQSTIA